VEWADPWRGRPCGRHLASVGGAGRGTASGAHARPRPRCDKERAWADGSIGCTDQVFREKYQAAYDALFNK
jgi:hypothetical protein